MASRRRTAKEWSRLIKRWERSGRSCGEFAVGVGVAPSTLSWWKWHLSRGRQGEAPKADGTKPSKAKPAPPRSPKSKPARTGRAKQRRAKDAPSVVQMVEVAAVVAAQPEVPVELVLGGGVVVRVRRGFDAGTLREVVAVFTTRDEPRC